MAALAYANVAPTHPSYSSNVASHYFQDSSFAGCPVARNHHIRSTNASSYPLSTLYIKYIRRVWKRVSRATRKPERASVLPDGFVLINNARLNASARRKSVLLS